MKEKIRIVITFVALLELAKMEKIGIKESTDFNDFVIYGIANGYAGPEFGQLEGHYLIIVKALYGLRTSGLRWHERFADCLRNEGFSPCKAEPDIWMRLNGDLYEYVATYVDDLCLGMLDPKSFTDTLQNKYNFKLKGSILTVRRAKHLHPC